MNWWILFIWTYGWLWLLHSFLFIKLFKSSKNYNPYLFLPFAFLCAVIWPFHTLIVLAHGYTKMWNVFFGIEEK